MLVKDSFCFKTSSLWQFVGYGLFALKILIPLIIIIFGVIDFVKALISSDDKEIKKVSISLFKRLIVGVCIFFIPTVVSVIFAIIKNVANIEGIDACSKCLFDPLSSTCNEYIKDAEEERKNNNQVIINKEKEDDEPDSGDTPSGGDDFTYNTYTSTKNGVTYNLYYQNDAKWGNIKYPDGVTIASRGCMISAIAVVASAFDKGITPLSVFNSSNRHNHPHYAIELMTNNNIDCFSSSNRTSSYVADELNKGNVVVLMVYGKSNGGSSKFTSSQHYMALLDISGNEVFVGNGYGSSSYATTGWYSLNDVMTSVQYVGVCEVN